jgi:copper chaperone CopZ
MSDIIGIAANNRIENVTERITIYNSMKNAKFTIDGINDNQSVSMIKDTIEGFTGVNSVDLSENNKTLLVNHDPTLISEEKIKQAIEIKGFSVKEG